MPVAEAERARHQLEEDVARLSEAEIDALMEVAGLPDSVLIPRLVIYRIWQTFTETYRISATEADWGRFIASMEGHIKMLIEMPIECVFSHPYNRNLDQQLVRLLKDRLGIATIADLCRLSERHLAEAGFSEMEIRRIKDALYNESHNEKLRLMG